MTYLFELWIDGNEVEHINTALGMTSENKLLETVFPDQYWGATSPRDFDFSSNEELAKKAIVDYLESATSHKRNPFYLSSSKTRNDARIASLTDMQNIANDFAREFKRIYEIGMLSQRTGKEVRVRIST